MALKIMLNLVLGLGCLGLGLVMAFYYGVVVSPAWFQMCAFGVFLLYLAAKFAKNLDGYYKQFKQK